jgi:hypothetical protein
LLENLRLNPDINGSIVIINDWIGTNTGYRPLESIPVDYAQHGFVKIDVDGGDAAVSRSGDTLLTAPFVKWLIETYSRALEQECISKLREYGYQVRLISHRWWRLFLSERRPIVHNRWLFAEK